MVVGGGSGGRGEGGGGRGGGGRGLMNRSYIHVCLKNSWEIGQKSLEIVEFLSFMLDPGPSELKKTRFFVPNIDGIDYRDILKDTFSNCGR